MTKSYQMRIDPRQAQQVRVISDVRHGLLDAFDEEHVAGGLTQQMLAERLGVNKSVVSKRLGGEVNLTLRSIADLAWAMGREIKFVISKPAKVVGKNEHRPTTFTGETGPATHMAQGTATDSNVTPVITQP